MLTYRGGRAEAAHTLIYGVEDMPLRRQMRVSSTLEEIELSNIVYSCLRRPRHVATREFVKKSSGGPYRLSSVSEETARRASYIPRLAMGQ